MSPNLSSLQVTGTVDHAGEQRVPAAGKEQKPARGRDQVRGSLASPSKQRNPVCDFLSREEYPQWDLLVDKSPHGTVFHYSWWLEAVSPNFKLLAVRDEKGGIVAGLPLSPRRRAGFRLFHSPSLTPYFGPIFDLSGADNVCDQLYLMREYGEILGKSVVAFDSFRCATGALAPDLQGLLWAGFRVSLSSYTFRFPAGLSLDDVRSAMTRTHLQKLQKARAMNLSVRKDEDVNELTILARKTFERQNLPVLYDLDLIRRLWAAASARGKAHVYVVKMPDGTPVSALFTVNDHRTTYQIVSGVDTAIRNVQGAYLLLWHAIEDALAAKRAFDFEGSGIRGVEAFYRRWGATAFPVWRIEKCNSWRGAVMQFFLQRRHQALQSKPQL